MANARDLRVISQAATSVSQELATVIDDVRAFHFSDSSDTNYEDSVILEVLAFIFIFFKLIPLAFPICWVLPTDKAGENSLF